MKRNIIRIFISSTFEDMQDERSVLMSKVFPNLAYEASLRGLSLVPIDLRWGITQKDAENGKVIRTCLDEIENSKPYFIGILGSRYGWQPNFRDVCADEDTIYKYPWLSKDLEDKLSMTEIEMQFGVLRSQTETSAAFYIKKDCDVAPLQKKLIDKVECFSHENDKNLSYYSTAEELGELVRADFMDMLQREFPIETQIDAFLNECIKQDSYLNSFPEELLSRQEELDYLISFIRNQQHTLTLYSPSGYGKSALLSKFVHICKLKNPNLCIIPYFLSEQNSQTNSDVIANYLEKAVKKQFGIAEDSQCDLESVFYELSNQGEKILIIIDGVENLSLPFDNHNSCLSWLPIPPPNVQYILSTKDKAIFDDLCERTDCMMKLTPLSPMDVVKYIKVITQDARKQLEDNRIEAIANDYKSKNLHMVDMLFHNMIYNCVFSNIDTFIAEYNNSDTIDRFMDYILCRTESIFGEKLVRQVISVLYVSGYGLTESELIKLCNVPQLLWSQLWCANRYLFIQKGNQILLNKTILSESVLLKHLNKPISQITKEYMHFLSATLDEKRVGDNICSAEDIRISLKVAIGGTLSNTEISHYVSRIIRSEGLFVGKRAIYNELIYQYQNSQNLNGLYEILSDPICFIHMSRDYEYSIYSMLKQLKNKEYDICNLINIKNEEYYSYYFLCEYYASLAHVLNLGLTNSNIVVNCYDKSLSYASKTHDQAFIDTYTSHIKINKIALCQNINEQMDLYKEQIKQLSDNKDALSQSQYISTVINYTQALHEFGDNDTAIALLEQSISSLDELKLSIEEKLKISCELKRHLANILCVANPSRTSNLIERIKNLYNQAYDESLKLIKVNRKKHVLCSIQTLHDFAQFLFEETLLEEAKNQIERGLNDFPMDERDTLSEYDETFAHLLSTYIQICTNLLCKNYDAYDYRMALTYSNYAISTSRNLVNLDENKYSLLYADVLYAKARLVSIRKDEMMKCIGLYKDCLTIYERLQSKNQVLRTCLAIGKRLYRLNQNSEAVNYLEKGLACYQAPPNNKETLLDFIKSLFILNNCYIQLARPSERVSTLLDDATSKLRNIVTDEEYNVVMQKIENS